MPRKVKSRLLMLIMEKERQEGRRISQTEVANAIGVKKHTITNWVHGKHFKKLETEVLERLCDYFSCEIGDVIYLETVKDSAPSDNEAE